MRKLIFTLIFNLVAFCPILAQSISNITLSKNADKIAYLKNADSLFISDLSIKNSEILVDSGLKDNGNQRFLNWSDDSQFLIYEKQENLKIYSLKEQTSKIIQHKNLGAFRFFQWYLIRQTAITPKGELYFSAGLKNDKNLPFQLFKLNVFNADLKQLTNSDLDAANVAASRDGERVIFNFYQYVDNQPESQINIINTNDGNVLVRSETYKNTFFSGFKWSPNGNLILARMSNGRAMLFRFKSDNASLEEVALSLESDESPVDFYNDSTLLYVKTDDKGKKIGTVNLDAGKKQLLIDENSTYLGLATKDGKSDIFFVSESRIHPKSIWKIEISGETPSQKTEVKSFETQNPLAKYSYVTYWYKNNAGGLSSSYIYLPADFSKGNKKYSLLIVPYGGYSDTYPELSYFLYSKLFKYLDEGFIIAFPNTRGIDYERQTKDYGKLQLEDTEKFINEIIEKYRIKSKEIFVLGHSHGATMVYYYLTHSDIFAGGIAVNGAADWIKQADRKSMSGLPAGMGGTPVELKDKYLESSPLENINNLKSPLLLFAGKKDTQIPYDINAESFHLKAAANKKTTKLILFDDEGHLIENNINRNTLWKEIDLFLKRKRKHLNTGQK